ncbi:hypothetical protein FA13DRAFT_1716265 [Coprinellus micaceus]|uniref:Uncharacterized protein n=1 Tax=Coprinellus micaceus TaxID=71717 RepID=A0A4Y7SK58_COPMI|nr:hypothetical protein FA13DRAFT_1716265 [Coprinellus micaceus]
MPWDALGQACSGCSGCSGVLRGAQGYSGVLTGQQGFDIISSQNNYKNNYNKGGWCLGIRGLVAGVRWQGRASDRDDVAEMVESGLVAGMRWQRQWAGGGLVAGVVAGVEVEVEVVG